MPVLPVPDRSVSAEAPVTLPTVTVFANAPVPTFTGPVVVVSSVTAVVFDPPYDPITRA